MNQPYNTSLAAPVHLLGFIGLVLLGGAIRHLDMLQVHLLKLTEHVVGVCIVVGRHLKQTRVSWR